MSVNASFNHPTKRVAIRSIQVTNPAAGADWSLAVPAGMTWRVKAVTATFTASSQVASRVPALQVKDSAGNVIANSAYGTSVPASNGGTISWFWGAARDSSIIGGLIQVPLFRDVILPENFTIGSLTVNVQTNDTWTSISLLIEEASSAS